MRNKVFLKKRFKVIMAIGILASLLGAGYFVQHVNNSRERVISKLEVSLKQGDLSAFRRLVVLNGERVSKEKLKPLLQYYIKNPQSIDSLISGLKKGEDTSVFKIKSEKKDFLNIYKLEVNTYNVKLNSNFKEGKFTINNEEYISSGECLEDVIPGIYTITGLLQGEYGDIETSQEFVLMRNEELNIKFDAINISIQSIFKDAEVYINGEDTGKTVEKLGEIGPFKTDKSSFLYIEKSFPWGTIRSKDEYIKDIPVINLNINIKNESLMDELTQVSNKFYDSVFAALNTERKSCITNADEDVKNKIYSILEERYFLLKNQYSVYDIKIVEEKSEFTYSDGKYRANILVQADYSVEKRLFALEKNKFSKSFFTKLVYDEESQEWTVFDVENFAL